MELKQFIKEALKDIIGGVYEAQSETDSGEIVPHVGSQFKSVELGISEVQPIEFEVTINVDEKKGSEAKLSVVAAVVGGSVQGKSDSSSGHAAKLKFNIPVRLPAYEKNS